MIAHKKTGADYVVPDEHPDACRNSTPPDDDTNDSRAESTTTPETVGPGGHSEVVAAARTASLMALGVIAKISFCARLAVSNR